MMPMRVLATMRMMTKLMQCYETHIQFYNDLFRVSVIESAEFTVRSLVSFESIYCSQELPVLGWRRVRLVEAAEPYHRRL